MQVGQNGRHRILPLEADGEVDHDAHDHHGQRLDPVCGQLLPDLRPHKLRAAQLHFRVCGLEGHHHLVTLLGRTHTLLGRQADHHIARIAEVLHLHVLEPHVRHLGADFLQVCSLRITHLHHGAARELDRQVQTPREQEEHGQGKRHEGNRVEDQRVLHERNVFADLEKFHASISFRPCCPAHPPGGTSAASPCWAQVCPV